MKLEKIEKIVEVVGLTILCILLITMCGENKTFHEELVNEKKVKKGLADSLTYVFKRDSINYYLYENIIIPDKKAIITSLREEIEGLESKVKNGKDLKNSISNLENKKRELTDLINKLKLTTPTLDQIANEQSDSIRILEDSLSKLVLDSTELKKQIDFLKLECKN